MKRIVKIVLGVCALTMIGAGCALVDEEGSRNEVLRSYLRYVADGAGVICVEQERVSTDNNVSKISDVYTCCDSRLQAYRIENRKVVNYRWSDSPYYSQDKAIMADYDAFWGKVDPLYKTLCQLPNRLEQDMILVRTLGNCPTVTVTQMGWFLGDPMFPHAWLYWGALQWTGTHEEAPAEIEEFCQAVAEVFPALQYARKYRSYLRAIPLFTDADIEAEKNTPLINENRTRYHVRRAIQHPYLLIPVHEQRSPLPNRSYRPGDKFKVKCEWGGKAYYFLIETFKGG